MRKLLALVFVVTSMACAPPDSVQEVQSPIVVDYTTPWPSTAVWSYFGISGGNHWVIFKSTATSECVVYYAGGSVMYDWVHMTLSSKGDSVEVPGTTNGSVVTCDQGFGPQQWYFSPPVFGGSGGVNVDGGLGNDFMDCNGPAISCDGQGGNDFLISSSTHAYLSGGDQDDTVITTVASASNWLDGGNGNDCLSAPQSPAPARYNCGATYGDKSTGVLGALCEILVTSCP